MTDGMDIVAELRQVTELLDLAGVDYALCGGLAMAVYALPRATLDIDLLIQVEALRRLCLSLARSGVAQDVARKHPDNERVARTVAALDNPRG